MEFWMFSSAYFIPAQPQTSFFYCSLNQGMLIFFTLCYCTKDTLTDLENLFSR